MPISFRIFHSLLWSTQSKALAVNKAEIDVFLELSCFFDDTADVDNLISGSSAFSKTSLNIWKFMVHVLLKLGLENFEHYFTSVWDECNCAVVWAFFGIAFLWDWNENWRFPVLYILAYILSVYLSIYLCISIIFCFLCFEGWWKVYRNWLLYWLGRLFISIKSLSFPLKYILNSSLPNMSMMTSDFIVMVPLT